MTTEPETPADSNMFWKIPDDWAAELRSGHIIVAPADIRSGAVSPRGYIVYVHDEQKSAPDRNLMIDPLKLRDSLKALEQIGYTYQGFRPWPCQRPAERATAYEIATALAQYGDRLTALREAAEDDDVAWNEDSAQDFQAFITDNPYWRKAGLALMDNGNLRAVWEWDQDDETHLALQFLGNKRVQFVIFKRRLGSGKVSRVAGADTFDGIKQLVVAFELTPLVHLHDKPQA